MAYEEDWVPLSWHCENCGIIVTALRNSSGDFKVSCPRCRTVSVKRIKSRTHTITHTYAPEGMVIVPSSISI